MRSPRTPVRGVGVTTAPVSHRAGGFAVVEETRREPASCLGRFHHSLPAAQVTRYRRRFIASAIELANVPRPFFLVPKIQMVIAQVNCSYGGYFEVFDPISSVLSYQDSVRTTPCPTANGREGTLPASSHLTPG